MRRMIVVVVVGACSVEPTAVQRAAIIGPAHPAGPDELPATGALLSDSLGFPSLMCTGTLIAPDVVLTAAHCTDSVATSGGLPSFTFAHYAHIPPTAQILAATRAVAHPDWHGNVPPGQLDQANDIGLLFLAQPVTDIAPALLVRDGDAADVTTGLAVTLVGYGYNDGAFQEAGVPGYEAKMVGSSHVAAVGDHELEIYQPGEAGACNGDSGGPAYAELGDAAQRVTGLVSRGIASMDCTQGGIFTRVDPYLAWIASQVALPCGSGPAPACAGDDAGVGRDASDPRPDADPSEPDHGSGGGCGCRTGDAPLGPALVGLLAVGLILRRRRTV